MVRTTCASGKRARNLEEDRVSQIDSTPWKSRGRYFEEEDQISQLPDEILIFILCHCQLSLKEAASTCILSKRWKYLWTYIKALNFPSSETYIHILRLTKSQDVESNRYAKWVTKVLDSHRGSTIDELRVRFPLDCNYSSHIDNWIDSAIRKRVKMLEMDFSPWFGGYPNLRYTFPGKSFSQSCIKSLTFLSLKYVNVTGELIDHFLSCCPLLEQLFLAGSEDLVNLKVYGSSLRLRILEIVSCSNLEAVEIFAPNLFFFYFGVGQRTKILIEHAPSLVDVSVGDYLVSVVSYALNPFFSCFSQLETLTLCMTLHREAVSLPQFPELPGLKNLILRVNARANDSLLSWASLINGSPFLERFTLQGFDNISKEGVGAKKTEVELYLEEARIYRCIELDILEWWKGEQFRYPVLSQIAREVLSIPVSTVASESAFSIGGRVLDQYRSSLLPETVQALLCTRDWLFGKKVIEKGDVLLEELTEDVFDLDLNSNAANSSHAARSGPSGHGFATS